MAKFNVKKKKEGLFLFTSLAFVFPIRALTIETQHPQKTKENTKQSKAFRVYINAMEYGKYS